MFAFGLRVRRFSGLGVSEADKPVWFRRILGDLARFLLVFDSGVFLCRSFPLLGLGKLSRLVNGILF